MYTTDAQFLQCWHFQQTLRSQKKLCDLKTNILGSYKNLFCLQPRCCWDIWKVQILRLPPIFGIWQNFYCRLVLLYLGDNFSTKCLLYSLASPQKIRRLSARFSFSEIKRIKKISTSSADIYKSQLVWAEDNLPTQML